MSNCQREVCSNVFIDGYCDTCGDPQVSSTPSTGTGSVPAPRVREDSVVAVPIITRVSQADMDAARAIKSRQPSLRSQAAPIWPLPSVILDESPLSRIMSNPQLPASKMLCPQCGTPAEQDSRFCENCNAELHFEPSLHPGELVAEQYENAGCIAYGSMGWIYLARDVRLERWVVLKGLLNSKDAGAAAAAALEKRHLSAIRHSGIVAIHDYVEHAGFAYIVMEYVAGISLKEFRVEHGPLSIHEALGCLLHLLPSLQFMHDAGLVYCDLKPENLMLTPNGIKLIDLGAVRHIGETTEAVYGTPGYMPALDGPDAGVPSTAMDIYAAGRTLAALLLDFDNVGEHGYSLPPSRAINRMFGHVELNRLLGTVSDTVNVTLTNGERLPSWLMVSRLLDKKADVLYVVHGSAPDGFTRLDVQVSRDAGEAATITLSCPLAFNSLRDLLERATHPDPEGRFNSAADMAGHCAGVLRELLGAEGFPAQGQPASFAQADRDISIAVTMGMEWSLLPPPMLRKDDSGFEAVARALDERNDENRLMALGEIVRTAGAQAGIDAHLRYVETALSCDIQGFVHDAAKQGEVRHFLRLASQVYPWDWRPAWMEGKYWMAMGKPAAAAACFSYVSHILPGESLPKTAQGMALEYLEDTSSALMLHDAALRASPGLAPARFLRLRCLFLLADPEFDAAWKDFIRAWPNMQQLMVEFMRGKLMTASDETFAWKAGRVIACGMPNDASMLRMMATRLEKLDITSISMPGQAGSVVVAELRAKADILSPHTLQLSRPTGLANSISKAMGGFMGAGWKRGATP